MKIDMNEYRNDMSTNHRIEYDGQKQSVYFASLIVENIPEWLVHEINEYSYSICDLGCEEGDSLVKYRSIFFDSELFGEDCSEKAIEKAKNKYSQFRFKTNNILEAEKEEKHSVVICSNVLEHFKDYHKTIKKVCERAEKYIIVLLPYREPNGAIEEHENIFHTKDILIQIKEANLVYAKTIKCNSEYYPFEQILLIYSKKRQIATLSDLAENISTDKQREIEENILCSLRKNENIVVEQNNLIAKKENELRRQKQEINNLTNELNEYIELQKYSEMIIKQKNEYMCQVIELSNQFAQGKLMKLNHLIIRVYAQLLKGNKEEKKDFMNWISGKAKRTNRKLGKGAFYNPWMFINNKLQDGINVSVNKKINFTIGSGIDNSRELENRRNDILGQVYNKYDVIILSVIDFEFRHQRPQHFATKFASNGHRVYYINTNFHGNEEMIEREDKLNIVSFNSDEINNIYVSDGKNELVWLKEKLDNLIKNEAISDAVIIVDYPNWIYAAQYMREKFGFKIVADYMDDFTGFIGTAEAFLKENCIHMLKTSDAVVSSSDFLSKVASKYTNKEKVAIVRNGTEIEHFYKAISMRNEEKTRPIIGYYGAVSHWFAWEKIVYLADEFPQCDIVIVGEVTEYLNKLNKKKNIKLLGEKAYADLPKYLADFDVCLIPFDTSTDLIKATNPVKFYEYLSAGKKIVATEIPELLPYRNEYVYMSNDNKEFSEYVRLCLEEKDVLKNPEECISFAKKHDWQCRYESMQEMCRLNVPRISIIILTFNNLVLNKKCIESIYKNTAYPNFEVIIVDNNSTDGTKEYLDELQKQDISNLTIIFNEENKGFAGGNNDGIRVAKGEYILLLNNDTMVTRGWLTNMCKHLENNKKYGMCNPVTNSIGNESQIKVEYTDVESMKQFAYKYTTNHMNEIYGEVDRLPLFATLIKKEVIEKVGLLDEEYKIGMFEDDDYSEAAINAGYSIVIVEDSFVHHFGNASFKKLDQEEYKKIFEENRKIFENKWNRKWKMPKYREGVFADSNEVMHVNN